MRKTLITILMLLICITLAAPVALAIHYEYIDFQWNGNTYTIRYNYDGRHFERVNAPAETFKDGSFEWTAEYGSYIEAEESAKNNFLRIYGIGDLGDSSLPLWALCASAVGLACLAQFVHGKRRSLYPSRG